jgi:uncharacterized protein YjdB
VNLGNAVLDIPFEVEIELYEVTSSEILATYTISDMTVFACPKVTDVEIKNCPENGWMLPGDVLQMEIEITPFNAFIQDVTWSSSNPNTAIVDQDGIVTAVMSGTTVITVTTVDGGFIDECLIKVLQPVTGVVLNKMAITLKISGEETLIATIFPENATIKEVEWESDDTTIATVDVNGKVTGIAAGTAIITVTTADGGFTAECEVIVEEEEEEPLLPPTGITVTPKTLNLDKGKTNSLVATVTPVGANPAVTWSSGSPTIATVDATGLVKGIAAGKAVITAKTINGLSATCTVTVTVPVDTILILPDECTLQFKGTKALKATVEPADASNKTIVWSSSDATIATVSSTGTVTAKSVNGECIIYATNAASGKVGVCYVTVGTGGKTAPAEAEGSITIYPNPTDGQLIIDNGELTIENVEIFNVMGQYVYLSTLGVASTLRFDISHLPTGVYFVRITTENGKIVTKKIIKN